MRVYLLRRWREYGLGLRQAPVGIGRVPHDFILDFDLPAKVDSHDQSVIGVIRLFETWNQSC